MLKLKTKLTIKQASLFLIVSTGIFMFISCVDQKEKGPASPPGYDINKPKKYIMPDILQEISGIALQKGDSSFIYAQQDEDGSLFRLPIGSKDKVATKFSKKGDYEDVAILSDKAIILKSNGDFFSFALSEIENPEAKNVKESKDVLPKGEYEGMFADELTGKIYVICKTCKEDKDSKNTTGYILNMESDGTVIKKETFKLDVGKIDQLTGKKKGAFHPSALAINPLTKEWYIVSSVNKVLLVADKDWKVKGAYHLSANIYNQPEGIAFDKEGNLYISNEGSETQAGNILRFDYKKP